LEKDLNLAELGAFAQQIQAKLPAPQNCLPHRAAELQPKWRVRHTALKAVGKLKHAPPKSSRGEKKLKRCNTLESTYLRLGSNIHKPLL